MEIQRITEQNPWWEDEKAVEKDEKIQVALTQKQPLILPYRPGNRLIAGPRQVGKTTYLKLCIRELLQKGIAPQKILYFSCETIRGFEEILEIIRFADTLVQSEKYLFLDEITFVPDWQKAVKYFLDSPLQKDKNLYITGSSSLALKKETFPGRKIQQQVFLPLSFGEYCQTFGTPQLQKLIQAGKLAALEVPEIYDKAKKVLFSFNEINTLFGRFLQSGGFPKSIYELAQQGRISDETYEIYWQWLVSDLAKTERSQRIGSAVLLAVLKNYGSRFSLNSVAQEMEIGSHVTIRDYLEILENLFVLRNVFAFEPRRKAEAFRKMRKVYFTDHFLFVVFKKMLTQTSVYPQEEPKLVEGMVAEHLARKLDRIFYLSGKKEVDFGSLDFGVEVKWQKKVSLPDFPPVQLKNKILLSKSDFNFFEKEKVVLLPAALFLAML